LSKIKDEILDVIQTKKEYREIIININRNNDKYNSLIKIFSKVIDNLIVNGRLIEYANNNH
jgi:hypothetical protein